jgi:hypothetical protein
MSNTQLATITEQRNVLREKLTNWVEVRSVYLPGLLQLLTDISQPAPPTSEGHPEAYKLWLPSELPPMRRRATCVEGLPSIEARLRTAQCYDALNDIRYIMRVKARMVQFKNQNVRGQRDGVRSRAVIDRVQMKAMAAVRRYRDGREAKLTLEGPGDWEDGLRVLMDADVVSYKDPNRLKPRVGRVGTNEDEVNGEAVILPRGEERRVEEGNLLFNDVRGVRDGTGEKRKLLSWIWTAARNINVDDYTEDDDQILRSEWCKSRARSNRGVEEVNKVKQEMKRTLRYLQWRAEWWTARVDLRPDAPLDLQEGLRAYARKQELLQENLRTSFQKLWGAPLVETLAVPLFQSTLDEDGDDEDDEDDDGEESEVEGEE